MFPEIVKHEKRVTDIIADEEESFGRTLLKGIDQFKKIAAKAKEDGGAVVDGAAAFLLWESFGFPIDLTEIMAEENGMTVDTAGFDAAFKEAQEKSRAGGKKSDGPSLLFEAEATSWLQKNGSKWGKAKDVLKEVHATHQIAHAHDAIPFTDDSPKYDGPEADPSAVVKAILTLNGFVESTEGVEGPIGLVLDPHVVLRRERRAGVRRRRDHDRKRRVSGR